MRIAVASGKGGTGKTTVATNLVRVATRRARSVAYLDCDVEEPNGAIFLKPRITKREPVLLDTPVVNRAECTGCGLCGQICQFSAIVLLKDEVLTFPELCHACGGCRLVCPVGAVGKSSRRIGTLETGTADGIDFLQGTLKVGEALSPPVIHAVKGAAPEADLTVIDCPPGTSCPVIEGVRGADVVLLVTEPTPFGLHDLTMAVDMVRALDMAFAVVLNRAGMGDGRVLDYCRTHEIEVIAEIPDDRRIAEAYSRGLLACETSDHYRALFGDLLARLGILTYLRGQGAGRPEKESG